VKRRIAPRVDRDGNVATDAHLRALNVITLRAMKIAGRRDRVANANWRVKMKRLADANRLADAAWLAEVHWLANASWLGAICRLLDRTPSERSEASWSF
jgi:hypothetical protein